ncbi:hypothetical protein [Shimazuella alba]|uniref:Uncharacterized protein n=1 Tax=Shimazuella alba TaxID=2690964 RepID=A0A6I4VPP5_9BACL|nr:hypothetical protein [Shimazuella alba]MXQ52341.1 hypothetical protein [Shimazuella alba]
MEGYLLDGGNRLTTTQAMSPTVSSGISTMVLLTKNYYDLFKEKFGVLGGFVPVYSDPAFEEIPQLRDFIHTGEGKGNRKVSRVGVLL